MRSLIVMNVQKSFIVSPFLRTMPNKIKKPYLSSRRGKQLSHKVTL